MSIPIQKRIRKCIFEKHSRTSRLPLHPYYSF